MSIRTMSIVWDAPIKPPSLKLAVLALADWSNDEGGSLYPSMSAIAKKVGVSRCQAQRLVQTMKAEGVLSVVANAYGGKPGATPHYQLHMDRVATWTGSAHATGSASDTGSTDETRRVAPMHKRGSAHATQTTINRQVNQPRSADAGAGAELASPMTAKEQVWTLGPALLGDKARSVLGKLVATYGEELVSAVLVDCAREQPGDPKPWVIATCAKRQGKPSAILSDATPTWVTAAGFKNRFEAENAGCSERNHAQFANGKKREAA